jgi:fibronectin type 3 domain-containing protein
MKMLICLLMFLTLFCSGCGNPSGGSVIARNHTPLLKPPAPFQFYQIRAATGNVTLKWQASTRASAYKIFMGTSSSAINTEVTQCAGLITNCSLTGLDPNTIYYFNVEASNAAGKTAISSIGKALSVGSFTSSSSGVGDGFMDLSWTASSNASAYNILYGTSPGAYSNQVTNVTSPYRLTGLNNGVTYYVRVVAVNIYNGYLMSDGEENGKPFGPPPAPTGLALSVQPGVMNFSWNPAIGSDTYNVYRGTVSGSLNLVASGLTSTSYQDNTTLNGTTYFWAVEGYNGYTSPRSGEVSGRGIDNFSMTSVDPGSSPNQMVVSWPAVTGAGQYNVRYGTNPSNLNNTITNATSPRTISGLTGGTTYYFRVVALNSIGVGTSVNSTNQLSGTPIPPISAPTGFTATASPGQVVLNWNNVSGASHYELLRGTTSGSYTVLQSIVMSNSYTDTPVTNGTTYYYVVRSYNGLYSGNSAEVAVRPVAASTISTVTPISSSSLEVSWSAAAGADSYDIVYGTTSGNYTGSFTNVTSPFTMTGLSPATTYYFKVRGRNAIGNGSSVLSAQSSGLTKTVSPSGFMASTTPSKISLNWNDVAGASIYRVYRGTISGSHTLLADNLTSSDFIDTPVSDGTSYYYVVTAFNGSESAKSQELAAMSISSFSLTGTSSSSPDTVTVSWPNVTGASTYDVKYGTSPGNYSNTLINKTSPLTITGLAAGTTYYLIVVAKNSVGQGSSINSNELSQGTPVGPPIGVAATVGEGKITLSWNTMTGASSYKVYRGTVSGTYGQLATNIVSTSFVDNTITDGVTYYYVIKSYNGADSDNSAEVSGKAITAFSIDSLTSVSTTSLAVTFPTTTGGDAYDIHYGTSSGSLTSTISNVTSPHTMTGLAPDTVYYVLVKARNSVGSGATRSTPEVSARTPTAAPSSLTANSSSGKVDLSWNAVTGATSYKVYRGTVSGSYTLLASGISAVTYSDTTVTNGTTYYYVVKANNGSDSDNSNEVSTQPIANFSIASASLLSSSSIEVSWSTVTGATDYDVLWGTTSGSYNGSALSVTSPYAITGLAANTTYYLVVRAKNNIGSGSNINSTEISRKTPTSAPAGLTASASPGQIGLNWTAVSGASSYKVYRGTISGTYTELATGITSAAYLDTTVTNGSTYYYVVKAFNGSDSAYSAEVSVKPISSFSLTSATAVSSSSIDLSWEAASGAETYDVLYGTSTGVYLWSQMGVASPYTLTGLSAGTKYYISIRASNGVGSGTSHQSNEMSATTATAAPANLVATAITGQIDLVWDAVSGVTNYKLFRGTTSGSYTQIASNITGTSYTDTTITNGTAYYYIVKAFNGTDSPNSNEAAAQTISAFTIASTAGISTSSIEVTWNATAGASSYDVLYGTVSGTYTTISNVISPYTVTGLSSGTNYFIAVKARNSLGQGSEAITPEVTQITPIAAPTGLVATATPGTVNLTWDPVTGADSYKIFRGTVSGTYTEIASGVLTTSYTDTSVTDGTTYYYVVKAFNGADSDSSNEASVRPMSDFSFAIATTLDSTSIEISWSAVTGADSYDLKYGTTSGTYTTTLSNQTSPTTITSLSPGETYYIVVVAKNIVGQGTTVTSSETGATTAFGAPSGLTASALPSQVKLSWNAVAGASSYKVLRGTVSGTYTEIATVGSNSYTDTPVTNGVDYYYVVRAFNGTDSANSNEVSVRTIDNFSLTAATPLSASSLELTWGAATGADSYDIRYGTNSGSYTDTVVGATSPYTLTGLSAGTTYYISIQAKNIIGAGTSHNSNELSAKTSPAAPATLSAAASTGQVALTWSSVSSATSYNIYRGTVSGTHTLLTSGQIGTTFTDSTVTNGTIYYYVITAHNGTESVKSSEASAQPIASFSITSTTALSTTSIEVTWPTTAGATAYDVRYGTSSGSYSTTVSNVTSPYTILGLTGSTNYYIVVQARNTIGSGSSATTPEVIQITPLPAPTSLTASSLPGQVKLSWNSVAGADNYKLYRGTSSGSYSLIASGITATTYTDSPVTNGVTYYYVVKAFNGADSDSSNEAQIQSIENFAIASTSSPSASTIEVTWSAPAGGATYDIRYGTATGSYDTTIAGITSPYTLTGLNAGTNYYIVIAAHNAVGSGSSVVSSESAQLTALGAPTGLMATASPGQVGLNWDAMEGATSFKVYRGTTTGSYTLLASNVTSNAYLDITVTDGTTYYYVVRAFNGSDSADSLEVATQPIGTFSLTSATATSASTIDLTWGAATGATSYDVRYGTSPGVYLGTVAGVNSPYTLTGLNANTTYYISIQAKNAVGAGTSLDSNELSALTAAGAPTGLTASATPETIGLNWNSVDGASSYKIFRGTTSGSYTQLASGITSTGYIDTPVLNGTVYYYVVKAFNGTDSAESLEVAVKSIASLSLTAATPTSSTSIELTWESAAGADSYEVRYGTSPGVYLSTIANVTSPYSLTGLDPATLYYVSIQARNITGAGTTLASNELSATTATGAPSGLTALARTGQVDLSWNVTAGADNYWVYRGTVSGSYSLISAGVTTNTYSDTSVVNGTTYYYVIRAFNGVESDNSNEAQAAPIGSFTISSTTALSSSTIEVSWNSAPGATGYDILYGTATETYSVSTLDVTSPHIISGLSPDTTYYIAVRAKNSIGSGTSTLSPEVSQVTPIGPPTNLVATGGLTEVELSWTGVAGAISYKVLRGTVSGSYVEIASGITGTTFSDTTVTDGMTYFYVLKSYNGADSENSAEVTSRPIGAFSISSVTDASASSLSVSWNAAAGADSYDLKYGSVTGSYSTTLTAVSSPYVITGLATGTTYYVMMVARNAVGTGASAHSPEASGTTNTPPVLSTIADQITDADTALTVNFTLSDSNDILTCSGAMSGTSSNTTLVVNTSIVFSGTMPNCSATITPEANQAGTSTITFTASDGKDAVSQSFLLTVNPCTVAEVKWVTQPAGMPAGSLFGTAPQVSLHKADGTLCTSNTAPVTLVVSTDPSEQQDARITGTASAIPSGGYAHFTAASMERAGNGFTVDAVQNGVSTLISSSTFNVTALAAAKIVYYQQPLTSDPSTIIIPNPSVRTADIYGNYVIPGTAVNVTLSLQDNLEGALLGGTLTATTDAQGIASYSDLTVDQLGSYFLRATPSNGWAVIDSDIFDIIVITPQDTVAVLEMLSGPLDHPSGKSPYDRAGMQIGTNYLDGTTTYTWKIIGTNTGNQPTTVRLRNGTTDVTSISIPKNTTTPTLFSTTVANGSITPSGSWNLKVELGTAVIYSSRLIVKQVGAKRSQVYIPLSSIESTSIDGFVSTTSATYTVPNQMNFPTYNWNSLDFNNVNGLSLWISAKTSAGNACAALYNKTTGVQIGGELCTGSTIETSLGMNIPKTVMPAEAELEVRVRATGGGTASFYKTGLLIRLVNVVKMKAFQRVAPAVAALSASTNFVELRASSYVNDYGVGFVSEYLHCTARASTSGAGSFIYKSHGTNTSGTTGSSTITASTINFSTQSTFTSLEAGPVATTHGNNQFMSYAHTSGVFVLSHCLMITEADY